MHVYSRYCVLNALKRFSATGSSVSSRFFQAGSGAATITVCSGSVVYCFKQQTHGLRFVDAMQSLALSAH